jgi:adenine phosphoribosyltransferase
VGIESRGFIFGTALATKLGVGFVPIRKKGKLPWKTRQISCTLEYGEEILEIHEDAVGRGEKVVIVDDLLATGGTAEAAAKLVESIGGQVAKIAFVIELGFLKGRKKLKGYDVFSLIQY